MNRQFHCQHYQYYVDCNVHQLKEDETQNDINFINLFQTKKTQRKQLIFESDEHSLPENKNGKASASRGDVVSDPVAPAAAIAGILILYSIGSAYSVTE